MAGVFVILPFNHVNGTVADANEVMANNAAMRDGHNNSLHGTTGHNHDGTNWNGPKITAAGLDLSSVKELAPIGGLIGFQDFNGLVSFDTGYWKYCDGTIINNPNSPLNGITPDDMSNRYLVGFGTEGGGDIDTAAWATGAVGNASHQINIQHSHTVDSHTHAPGTLQFQTLDWDDFGGGDIRLKAFSNTTGWTDIATLSQTAGVGFGDTYKEPGANPVIETYYTASTGAIGVTGSTSPGTNNQLSTTQSIQPRSIRVRWIMRIR